MVVQSTTSVPDAADSKPRMLLARGEKYYQALLRQLHWPPTSSGGAEAHPDRASGPVRTLGITSCGRKEGVSTIAAQLAATAAAMDEGSVLLVDANLACPLVHRMFDVDPSPGLSELLLDPAALTAYVQPSGIDNLELLTAGEPNGSLAKAFDTGRIREVLCAVEEDYHLVVLDMAPAGLQSAALRLAGLLDGVVMVVEAERVRYEVARRTKQLLQRAGASVRGAVLNKRRDYIPRWLSRSS